MIMRMTASAAQPSPASQVQEAPETAGQAEHGKPDHVIFSTVFEGSARCPPDGGGRREGGADDWNAERRRSSEQRSSVPSGPTAAAFWPVGGGEDGATPPLHITASPISDRSKRIYRE